MKDKKQVKGEGNYQAAEEYNEAQKDFVKSGKVKDAAKQAEPKSPAEAEDMRRAEKIGRSHAKEEDPTVKSNAGKDS